VEERTTEPPVVAFYYWRGRDDGRGGFSRGPGDKRNGRRPFLFPKYRRATRRRRRDIRHVIRKPVTAHAYRIHITRLRAGYLYGRKQKQRNNNGPVAFLYVLPFIIYHYCYAPRLRRPPTIYAEPDTPSRAMQNNRTNDKGIRSNNISRDTFGFFFFFIRALLFSSCAFINAWRVLTFGCGRIQIFRGPFVRTHARHTIYVSDVRQTRPYCDRV